MSYASYESDPDALRAHFAIELRRQRTRSGLSMNRLAKAIGIRGFAAQTSMVERTESSKSTIGRIWRDFNLKPHQIRPKKRWCR
ncbi:hypothetical protein [Actinocorallia libanotica]|uniref:Helix-turn-helix protein n=1 Tax=Actinocorallia libanotica TaxID=46162 RepID=A0ABN1RSW9_9ACTN